MLSTSGSCAPNYVISSLLCWRTISHEFVNLLLWINISSKHCFQINFVWCEVYTCLPFSEIIKSTGLPLNHGGLVNVDLNCWCLGNDDDQLLLPHVVAFTVHFFINDAYRCTNGTTENFIIKSMFVILF